MSFMILAGTAPTPEVAGVLTGVLVLLGSLLIGLLIMALCIRVAARSVVKHTPSWGRALGIAVCFILAGGLISQIFDDGDLDVTTTSEWVSLGLVLLADGAIAGALLRTAEGNRIGFMKGLFVVLTIAVFAIVLLICIGLVGMMVGIAIPMLSAVVTGSLLPLCQVAIG